MTLSAPVFIGLDLAWSPRNPTGAAVIMGDLLVEWRADLIGDDEILGLIAHYVVDSAPAIVAVDAPLCVNNPPGSRRGCDSELSKAFARHKCPAHTVNRGTKHFADGGRGASLARRLAHTTGFLEGSAIRAQSPLRHVVEVYPHPAHVVLFKLNERLKYKRKRGRTWNVIVTEMARYQAHLLSLNSADPPLLGVASALWSDAGILRGKAYKAHEDTLDAITCAYIGEWLWKHGADNAAVYGRPSEGEIVVPGRPATPSQWGIDEPEQEQLSESGASNASRQDDAFEATG